MQYLHNEQYYVDRYDLNTIQHCLDTIEVFKKAIDESWNDKRFRKFSKEDKIRNFNMVIGKILFQIKTDEFRRKKETIQRWMQEDKDEQDKFDFTPIPKNIFCDKCDLELKLNFKELHSSLNEPSRMLFFFRCDKCKKNKAVYEDGEDYVSKPFLCPKCNKVAEYNLKPGDKVDIWITDCKNCGFHEEVEEDLEKYEIDRIQRENTEKELLENYRKEFCFDEKEGQESIETQEALHFADEVFEYEKSKFYDPVYDIAGQVQKLNITELEKLLVEKLEPESYVRLNFDRPEFNKYITVPFTLQDADSSRKENISLHHLEKIFKELLEKTNWRLIRSDLSYRLGFISGKLKGYEHEEDILQILGKSSIRNKELDPEKLFKYGAHSAVQLARIGGKYAGEEEVRKRRLEKEPDGFIIGGEGEGYRCPICSRTISGKQLWWDLSGIRCLDCQKNIKDGVISKKLLDRDSELFYKDWELSSDFGIHHATLRKLIRLGELIPTELKDKDGKIYDEIYLIKNNKEFFKNHKKLPKTIPQINFIDKNGGKVNI